MSTETFIAYLFKSLLLPPGINLLLALFAWIFWRRWRKTARLLLVFSASSLYAFSIPSIATLMITSLQSDTALSLAQLSRFHKDKYETPLAIVILGGGRRENAPEYGDVDTLHPRTLERVRYGAYLHKKTQQPVLVTGGSVFGESTSEAVIMNQVLNEEFNVPVQWLETKSNSTRENAKLSAQILKENTIQHILLVSHAWHLPRAKAEFAKYDITVIPAPTAFVNELNDSQFAYLPSAKALNLSFLALHEWVGRMWYSI